MGPDIKRIRLLAALLLLGLCGVWLRAFRLQINDHQRLARLAQEQYVHHVKIPARRGHIYDQSGAPLAITVDSPSIFANPAAIVDAVAVARALAPKLDLPVAVVSQKLKQERFFVWLKRHTTPAVAQSVRRLELPGIGITEEPRRSYPNREVGGAVIGLAGLDGQGLEGIEKQLEGELGGSPQMVASLRDARGQAVLVGGQEYDLRARGSDVTLSLDLQIQHRTELALAKTLDLVGAQAASAVVLDVATAEVLALATLPQLNPAEPGRLAPEHRRARALTDLVEPGSTLKPLVMAAALDRNAVTPTMPIFCEMGRFALRGHTINDTHAHAWLLPSEIIAKSSNIGMVKVAQRLGHPMLDAALRDFGLGQKTHIEFPGEVAGLLRPHNHWSELDGASIAFGQGLAVNLVQLAGAFRVLAADGLYREPRLIRSIRRADGSQAVLPRPPERRVIGTLAARRVTRMLEAAISPQGGTGRLAAVPGYRVAGKTGTAQKASQNHRGYSRDKYVALFAGYLPAEAPRVVVVVAVDEPTTNHFGGVVAAPVFSQVGAATMQRLGVVASSGAEVEQKPLSTAETEQVRAAPRIAQAAVDAVPEQARKVGPSILDPSDGQPTGPQLEHPSPTSSGSSAQQVPSFMGLTARQATLHFVQHQLEGTLTFTGFGQVVRQDPAAGSRPDAHGGVHLVLASEAP